MIMRDPERIPPLVGVLEEVWRLYPDLRLGQLLILALHKTQPGRDIVAPEVFFAEDSTIYLGLLALQEEWSRL